MNAMTPPRSRTPGLGAAWAVLIGTGITSVTYNVVHARQGARLEIVLALLLGLAPAFVAACLSHVAAVLDAPWWVKGAVIAVMLGGMVLSASNTAATVAPAEPGWRGWLFGIVLDAGALLALWAIMASRRRKVQAEAAMETARTEEQNASKEAALLAAALDQVKAELAAAMAELEAERRRASARKPKHTSARKRRPASAPETVPASGPTSAPEVPADDEFSAEAAAFQLWLGDKTIAGSKLGPMVGVSDSMGRTWVRKWKEAAPSGRQSATDLT